MILPLIVRSLVGRYASNLFAWLLALSPPLIFYSRFARPYSIALLCGFIGIIMFYKWWTAPNWRSALLYVIFASASGYFLLVALPFVFGPFLFFMALSLGTPRIQLFHSIKRLTCLGFLTLFPLLLLLGPPLYSDFAAISNKAGRSMVHLFPLGDSFRILTGQEPFIFIAITIVLAISGMISLCRKSQPFGVYLIALSLIHLVTILILKPIGADAPHILARYMLMVLPGLLIFVASGVEAVSGVFYGPTKKWIRILLPVGLCTLFFLRGPIPALMYQPNDATSLVMLIRTLKGESYHSILKRVPDFYKKIAIYPPSSLTIAETPFNWQGDHLPLYQKTHRQHILMGLWDRVCGETIKNQISMVAEVANLNTIVDLSDIDLLFDKGVDFVVFHKSLEKEVRIPLPGFHPQDLSKCIDQYRTRFGSPFFENEDIIVFEISGG
ncbi:MAG: hypothetical protein JRL30_13825 [Deltaproteobacteria bacterium]|nr:hypothetical protein [Deltaproteobacteria bacterium]